MHLRRRLLTLLLLVMLLCAPGAQADITTGLAMWWTLDAGTGTTVADSAGSNTGTLGAGADAPTWQSAGNCRIGASCLAFDGATEVVTSSGVAATGNYTVALWVYSNSAGSNDYGCLVGHDVGNGLYLRQGGTNSRHVDFYDTAGSHLSSTAISDNQWVHVGITRDNGSSVFTIYINGSAAGTYAGVEDLYVSRIGFDIAGQGFNGRLDDLRVYSRVLTAGDMTELVAAAPTSSVRRRRPIPY